MGSEHRRLALTSTCGSSGLPGYGSKSPFRYPGLRRASPSRQLVTPPKLSVRLISLSAVAVFASCLQVGGNVLPTAIQRLNMVYTEVVAVQGDSAIHTKAVMSTADVVPLVLRKSPAGRWGWSGLLISLEPQQEIQVPVSGRQGDADNYSNYLGHTRIHTGYYPESWICHYSTS